MSLKSLQNLNIQFCPGLASCWREGLFCLGSLRYLGIGGFLPEHEHFPWPSTSADASASADAANVEFVEQFPFISLEGLFLYGFGINSIKHLPDQLQHLTALKNLKIQRFEDLEDLPEWLGNLSSLQSVSLWSCPKLMSLPSLEAIQRLTNLRILDVLSCPLLKKRCKNGEERHKIAHIPYKSIAMLWVVYTEAEIAALEPQDHP